MFGVLLLDGIERVAARQRIPVRWLFLAVATRDGQSLESLRTMEHSQRRLESFRETVTILDPPTVGLRLTPLPQLLLD